MSLSRGRIRPRGTTSFLRVRSILGNAGLSTVVNPLQQGDMIGSLVFPDPDFGTYFRCQQRFRDYRLDFLFKLCLQGDYRLLAVECDGHEFHERTKEQAARDRSRDRVLVEAGVPVIRFTASEIYCDPQNCADEVVNHLAALNRDLLAAHGLGARAGRPDPPPSPLFSPLRSAMQRRLRAAYWLLHPSLLKSQESLARPARVPAG